MYVYVDRTPRRNICLTICSTQYVFEKGDNLNSKRSVSYPKLRENLCAKTSLSHIFRYEIKLENVGVKKTVGLCHNDCYIVFYLMDKKRFLRCVIRLKT